MLTTRNRVLLSLMMFFQYAVWGAWTPVLGETLHTRLHFAGSQIGAVYGVLWLACIITPFIGGQLVDRLMPSQVFLGLAALVCAGAAWAMAYQQTSGGFLTWMWVWSLAFAPTLGITNSILFYHAGRTGASEAQQERDFAVIRTWGTVGWIIAAFTLTGFLLFKGKYAPPLSGAFVPFEEMQLTALFGIVLAVVSFLLPNTPPTREVRNPWAFLKSFQLFRTVPGFTTFIVISFFASTEFQFFYVLSPQFLSSLGVKAAWLSTTKSVSQMAEIVSLAILLPLALKRFGTRNTLVIGTLAWSLRYFIFAMQKPFALVLFSLTFHGIGYAFVFITSYIYIDRVAPRDIRGSAQSLFTLITLGVGNWVGTLVSGRIQDHFTQFIADPQHLGQTIPGPVNWPLVFVFPALLTLTCAVAFWLTFREPQTNTNAAELQPAPVAL